MANFEVDYLEKLMSAHRFFLKIMFSNLKLTFQIISYFLIPRAFLNMANFHMYEILKIVTSWINIQEGPMYHNVSLFLTSPLSSQQVCKIRYMCYLWLFEIFGFENFYVVLVHDF